MNMLDRVTRLFQKPDSDNDILLSLHVELDYVQASLWYIGDRGMPRTLGSATDVVREDTWEARVEAADRAIATIESKAGEAEIGQVVLGIPSRYLTQDGVIQKGVRSEVKKLTERLELTAIGFVPVHQAIAHYLKRAEGVPPTAILLGATQKDLVLTLYKVGTLVGQHVIADPSNISLSVEEGLKGFKDVEVLPSRFMLYGGDKKRVDEVKQELLSHPWQSRVNFLHFPKIDLISEEKLVTAISYAGSAELSPHDPEDEPTGVPKEGVAAVTDTREDTPDSQEEAAADEVTEQDETLEEAIDAAPEPSADEDAVIEVDDAPKDSTEIVEKTIDSDTEDATEEESDRAASDEDSSTPDTSAEDEEESNVVMVDPESLGFTKNVDFMKQSPFSGLKKKRPDTASEDVEPEEPTRDTRTGTFMDHARGVFGGLGGRMPDIRAMLTSMPSFGGGRTGIVLGAIGVAVLVLVGLAVWVLPQATVTVLAIPETVEGTTSVTVDLSVEAVDAENMVIPGRTQEQSVSGDTSIAVSGVKDVGEPAKGTVTIYNKTLEERTFSSGDTIENGTLSFSLDGDVSVPAAEESIGSLTFGSAQVGVTAVEIGPQSNMPEGTEFTVSGLSSGTAIARSDGAFAGGTSREVTVVSRSDQDTLVETLTDDLVEQAKEQLGQTVTGNEKLIDASIGTEVTETTYVQELDQEASQLEGSITLTVTGISYSEDDLRSLFVESLASQVPEGYMLDPARIDISVEDAEVDDETVAFTAVYSGTAMPTIDADGLAGSLAGKKLEDAQAMLRETTGVGGVEFTFRYAIVTSRLPRNAGNISVAVALRQE